MTHPVDNLRRSVDAVRWRTALIRRCYVTGKDLDDWLRAKERAAVDRASAVRRLRVTACLCVVAVVALVLSTQWERWMP